MSRFLTQSDRSQIALLYLRLTMAAFLWGGTFVAGRMVVSELPPLHAATARFGLAALVLLLLLRRAEGGLPWLTWRQSLQMALLGLTGVCLYNLFFFGALSEMPASRTALFVAFNPIGVALASGLIARRLPPLGQAAGICLALTGALIVITDGDVAGMFAGTGQGSTQGEIYMLGAVVSWIAYTLLGRRALGVISPLAATTWAALFGFVLLALCLLVAAPAQVPHVLTPSSAGAILYLAVGGTVLPFVWYYQGVKALGPARTAVFTNLVPVFGVLLGATLLEEPVGLSMIAGGALVMAGISITNRG